MIWIIERTTGAGPRLASALIGDYAVRVFASLSSFNHLLRISRNRMPDLLLVDLQADGVDLAQLQDALTMQLPQTPVIYAAESVKDVQSGAMMTGPAAELVHRYSYQTPIDGLRLSAFVEQVLRKRDGADQRSVVRYRGVLLNYQRLEYQVLPGEEAVSLPRKEAQLLRLLLERPGVCLSREEIQDAIWEQVSVTPRTIDSHVSRLRRRLVDAEVEIISVYGGGYVLR